MPNWCLSSKPTVGKWFWRSASRPSGHPSGRVACQSCKSGHTLQLIKLGPPCVSPSSALAVGSRRAPHPMPKGIEDPKSVAAPSTKPESERQLNRLRELPDYRGSVIALRVILNRTILLKPENWIAKRWFVFQSGSLNVLSCHIVYVLLFMSRCDIIDLIFTIYAVLCHNCCVKRYAQ